MQIRLLGTGGGEGRPALQGGNASLFVHANQRPKSEWSQMTNMTFDSRGSRASKPKQLLLSGVGGGPPAHECARACTWRSHNSPLMG